MVLDHGPVCHDHDLDPVLLGPRRPWSLPLRLLHGRALVLDIEDVVVVSNVVVRSVAVAAAALHLELYAAALGEGGGSLEMLLLGT